MLKGLKEMFMEFTLFCIELSVTLGLAVLMALLIIALIYVTTPR